MCNGKSSRVSQGGTIAILSTPSSFVVPANPFEGELFFHSTSSGYPSTTASFRSRAFQTLPPDSPYHVVIHQKGDLSIPVAQAGLLHRFRIPSPHGCGTSSDYQWNLEQSLNLGVGGDGIIGRRVSIFEDAELQRQVAEGIIGWN